MDNIDDTTILQGRDGSDEKQVLAAWEKVLMRSARACAISDRQDDEKCLEVELRKVSLELRCAV